MGEFACRRRARSRAGVATAFIAAIAAAALLVAPQAAGAATQPRPGPCVGVKHAVVTDIDNTLTTDNVEFVKQWLFPQYDEMERLSAAELFRQYAAKGYWVVFVTGRNEDFPFNDGRTDRQVTIDWLEAHGFPQSDDRTFVLLSPDILSALYPRPYKAAVVSQLEHDGFSVDYAYGDAETDFQAYADAGLPANHVFSIGRNAGYGGTNPITDPGYTTHVATFMPTVKAVCDPQRMPPAPAAECPSVPYENMLAWIFEQLLHTPAKSRPYACH